MRTTRKLLAVILLTMLSISLFGQDNKPRDISYSFSYLPPSLYISIGDIGWFPVYANFEANVHYKPYEVISFSSGLGFFRTTEDFGTYGQNTVSAFRVPLQANYHLVKSPNKTDCYLKGVFTNGVWFGKNIKYNDDGTVNTTKWTSYFPSIGLGVGAIFLKQKKVGILLEGMIEKYLRFGDFTESTFFSLKIGVVL